MSLKILIVDDSSFMRKRLKSNLESQGHKVIGMAKDGAEGFSLYKETSPDLVIMDITMRGVDGIEGAKMIKEQDPNAQIVFMSLVQDESVIKDANSLNCLGFLGKNDDEGLLKIISKLSPKE